MGAIARFMISTLGVALVEVAAYGRLADVQLLVQIPLYATVGALATAPRPRQIGRYWGTMDQRFALEAERRADMLRALRAGVVPATADWSEAAGLLPDLRSEVRRMRLGLLLARAGAALSAGGTVVVVVAAPGQRLRLAALAALVVLTLLGAGRGSRVLAARTAALRLVEARLGGDA